MSALAPVSDPRVPWFARMKRTRLVIVDEERDPTDALPKHPRGRELTSAERAVLLLHYGIIQRDPPDVCAARRGILYEATDPRDRL